ncbi:MAG: iron ABC transporter permease [Pseudomonadota bacterium]
MRATEHSEIQKALRNRASRAVAGLILGLGLTGVASVSLGFTTISLPGIWNDETTQLIVQMRLARFVVAACVGASLSTAGLLMQRVLRNPLVEPGVLGLNAGAALAAAGVLLLSPGAVSQLGISVAASSGALLVMAIVLGFGWSPGQPVSARFILAGIALSALCGALLTALSLSSSPERLPQLLAWLGGDLNGMTFRQAAIMAGMATVLFAALRPFSRSLDALSLDTRSAAGIGIGQKMTLLPLLVAATAAGIATSVVGVVSFVGLVAPHLARRVVGQGFIRILPCTMLIGASLVALADLAGRLVLSPDQVPAGLITALVGAPWFFIVMARQND